MCRVACADGRAQQWWGLPGSRELLNALCGDRLPSFLFRPNCCLGHDATCATEPVSNTCPCAKRTQESAAACLEPDRWLQTPFSERYW